MNTALLISSVCSWLGTGVVTLVAIKWTIGGALHPRQGAGMMFIGGLGLVGLSVVFGPFLMVVGVTPIPAHVNTAAAQELLRKTSFTRSGSDFDHDETTRALEIISRFEKDPAILQSVKKYRETTNALWAAIEEDPEDIEKVEGLKAQRRWNYRAINWSLINRNRLESRKHGYFTPVEAVEDLISLLLWVPYLSHILCVVLGFGVGVATTLLFRRNPQGCAVR